MADVGLPARDAARAQHHVHHHDFDLRNPGGERGGTVNQHHRMDAAKQIVRLKLQVKALARIVHPSALAAFEPELHIVVGAFFIVDDGARQVVVAHQIGRRIHQGLICGGQKKPHIMSKVKRRLAIGDGVKRAGVRAGGRISGHRAQTINSPHK